MNANEFAACVQHLVAAAREDGAPDEAIIAKLRTIAETLDEGPS